MTPKQAYVFENLDRVIPLDYKVHTHSQLPRYQLDGVECTAQITSLSVQKLITKMADGRVKRRVARDSNRVIRTEEHRVGERQPVPADALNEVRALLLGASTQGNLQR